MQASTNWGIDIVRAGLKEFDLPNEVQDTMNKASKAENYKNVAADFADAAVIKADRVKHAAEQYRQEYYVPKKNLIQILLEGWRV